MFTEDLQADSLDVLSLASRLNDFLRRYETTESQKRLITVLGDELLYPLFRAAENPAEWAQVRLMCSETGSSHTMQISVRGISSDPLEEPYMDDLNRKILENYASYMFSRKGDNGWEIIIQM
jgi:hypothetical protein